MGLLMPFSYQLWVLFEGAGGIVGRSAARVCRFYDGLVEAARRGRGSVQYKQAFVLVMCPLGR